MLLAYTCEICQFPSEPFRYSCIQAL
ncbi:hypothetical protein FYZ41_06145 [Mobiluncus mulieris]|nr:hypothetical protein [Mobiluncus mulieris]